VAPFPKDNDEKYVTLPEIIAGPSMHAGLVHTSLRQLPSWRRRGELWRLLSSCRGAEPQSRGDSATTVGLFWALLCEIRSSGKARHCGPEYRTAKQQDHCCRRRRRVLIVERCTDGGPRAVLMRRGACPQGTHRTGRPEWARSCVMPRATGNAKT